MKKLEEYIFLSDRWGLIKVSDRNHKSHFRYRDFFLTQGKMVSEEDQELFDTYRNQYNHTYAVLKTLLHHGITRISLKGKEEEFLVREGKVQVDLTSSDIVKHMDDFLKSSGKQYQDARNAFLKDGIARKKSAYLFLDSPYKTSYEPVLYHGCMFYVMQERAHLLGLDEEGFILDAVSTILSSTSLYVEEEHELHNKKGIPYYSSVMENNDIDIRISRLSDAGMEKLNQLVEEHNKLIDSKKKLVLGGE